MYFDQLTLDSGKSVACHPVYHAAEIVELLRVVVVSSIAATVDKRSVRGKGGVRIISSQPKKIKEH